MCEVGLSGLFQCKKKICLHFLSWVAHIIDFFVCFNSRNKNSEGGKKPCLDAVEFRPFSSPEWKAQLSEERCQSVLFLLKCQYRQYL